MITLIWRSVLLLFKSVFNYFLNFDFFFSLTSFFDWIVFVEDFNDLSYLHFLKIWPINFKHVNCPFFGEEW